MMLSEGGSFVKGMALGGVFCLVLSLLGAFSPKLSSTDDEQHHHHHVKALSKDELEQFNDAQVQDWSKQVAVFCIVLVEPKLIVYWGAAIDTWTKHCDKVEFYTTEDAKALDAVDLKEKDAWARMRKALKHAYENADGLRWFFVVKPTTFAIVENLKYLVLTKDPQEPFYLGNVMKSGELEYVDLESGIVMSDEAMKRLMHVFEDQNQCPERGRALWKLDEDKQLAVCLKYSGVFAENGEDTRGKGLFNSKSVHTLISDSMKESPNNVLARCCSDMAVTFTGMSPGQMQVMMFGVYRLRPYGHDFHDVLSFYPPKGSDND